MKTFNDFMVTKEAVMGQPEAPQQPAGIFDGGIGGEDVPRVMAALRKMLGARGVVGPEQAEGAKFIAQTLRSVVNRLKSRGLSMDDFPMIVQVMANMMSGGSPGRTSFNSGGVNRALNQSAQQ